jgi:16S rRNA (adenine1518-N6/adenine1519-N6)-dimethyltransferase
MVRKLFLHRRKNLRHVLSGIWRDHWTKTEVEVWLESLGIDGQLRAEALGVDQFRTLAHALEKRWGHAIAQPSDALHDAVDEDGDEAKGRQDDAKD